MAFSLKEKFLGIMTSLAGLPEVEDLIRSKLGSDVSVLSEISTYLLDLGGKRIRPVLCLLSAQAAAGTPVPRTVHEVAAGIELIHMATLLHDDIIDHSVIRRHKESPYKLYGLPQTLLAGDFLLTRAFSLCAHLDTYVIEATEQACVELTEGEVLEMLPSDPPFSREHSLRISQKKTASLFRLASESAAHLCGLNEAAVRGWRDFGESLGIAFQIVDDILDVISTEKQLGKEPGTDIRERKPSFINVLWLESGDPLARRMLLSENFTPDAQEIAHALEVLRTGPVVNQAKEVGRSYALKALDFLREAPRNGAAKDGRALDLLITIVEYAMARME